MTAGNRPQGIAEGGSYYVRMVKRNRPLSDKQKAHYEQLHEDSERLLQEWVEAQLAEAPPNHQT